MPRPLPKFTTGDRVDVKPGFSGKTSHYGYAIDIQINDKWLTVVPDVDELFNVSRAGLVNPHGSYYTGTVRDVLFGYVSHQGKRIYQYDIVCDDGDRERGTIEQVMRFAHVRVGGPIFLGQ